MADLKQCDNCGALIGASENYFSLQLHVPLPDFCDDISEKHLCSWTCIVVHAKGKWGNGANQ